MRRRRGDLDLFESYSFLLEYDYCDRVQSANKTTAGSLRLNRFSPSASARRPESGRLSARAHAGRRGEEELDRRGRRRRQPGEYPPGESSQYSRRQRFSFP